MKYEIVMADDRKELVKKVNIMILDGWIPCGGLIVANFTGYCGYFYQAMTKV